MMLVRLLVGLLALPADPPGRARILVREEAGQWSIHAVFDNSDTPAGTLQYRLEVRKSGASGTSETSQSGEFETVPGREDTLAVSSLNVGEGDRIDARLVVMDGDRSVDEAIVSCTLPYPCTGMDP